MNYYHLLKTISLRNTVRLSLSTVRLSLSKPSLIVKPTLFVLFISPALAQVKTEGRLLHFTSAHTSFPDTARAKGHLYDSILYSAAEHYNDSSVLVFTPNYLHP